MTVFDDTLSDSVAVTPTLVDLLSLRDLIEEAVTLDLSQEDRLAVLAATAEALTVALAGVVTQAPAVRDTLGLGDTIASVAAYGLTLAEIALIQDLLRVAQIVDATEALTIEETIQTAQGWIIAEQLGIADTLSSLSNYSVTIEERLRLRETFARFLGGDIAETIQLAPSVVVNSAFMQGAAEVMLLSSTVDPVVILHIAMDEAAQFDDTDILQLIYAGQLRDDISIEAMHIDPAGGVVTWCINTRMGFVTQYKNYDFNSFAVVGGRYIGATSEGLFELHGDTDDGEQVIAGVTGGLLQMNSSRLHGLGGVYIGLRGTGEFFLKLTAGAGQEYVYRFVARDMETTKVNIGKGLRHRYLSYALESVGQEFELESIEFVPMRAFRRV